MDIIFFPDKDKKPDDEMLKQVIGNTYRLWMKIRDFVLEKYPNALEEWNYPGKKYGWSFRIKDKKRAIIYFLPKQSYFKVAFVFGDKAVNNIMESDIAVSIKKELAEARKYAEGRGVRIEIKDNSVIDDIKKLIKIKLAH